MPADTRRPGAAADPVSNPGANPAAKPGSADLGATNVPAQALAEQVRDAMWQGDHATKMLGMRITHIGPGSATLEMAVRQDMLNGHAICHGGLITTLADSSFAFACNSYNELTVASGFTVDLMAPGRLGDVLTATCSEVSKAGRTGVYDVQVHNQRGERIAVFRGRSYTARGKPVILPAA